MVQLLRLPLADQFSPPLPIYESLKLGVLVTDDGEEFEIFVGMPRPVVEQLKERSLDETDDEIQKNTSDRERFGEGSYEVWYAKDRIPFTLIHPATGRLAGLVWFGPKALGRKSLKHLSAEEKIEDSHVQEADVADNWHTAVYRSYLPFRGKGLMRSFTQCAIDVYLRNFPGAKLWVGVHSENPASTGLARSLGFVVNDEFSHPDEHHYVLTKE